MIHTPWNFDLQPSRVLLILGSCFFVFQIFKGRINKRIRKNKHKLKIFEIFLICYVIVSSIVIVAKAPGFRAIVPLVSGQLVFLVIYFISRDYLSEYNERILEKLIFVFGFLSVSVSIVQFFFAPEFFRISSERIAFGIYTRANGSMFDEYDNGLYLTCLTAVILYKKIPVWQKLISCAIFGFGVLLTMHRGSWLFFQ